MDSLDRPPVRDKDDPRARGFRNSTCKSCHVDLTPHDDEREYKLTKAYALSGRRDDDPAGPPRADACNAHLDQLCMRIGNKYHTHCCNCLKRMGALSDAEYNSVLCCNSCRARWSSLPDKGPLPKPSTENIEIAKNVCLCLVVPCACEIM